MTRWYIFSYRHPGTNWIDYGEPINAKDEATVLRLIFQLPPFTEVRIKILDVKEPN